MSYLIEEFFSFYTDRHILSMQCDIISINRQLLYFHRGFAGLKHDYRILS